MFNILMAISNLAGAAYFRFYDKSEIVIMGLVIIANIYIAFIARDIDRKEEQKPCK